MTITKILGQLTIHLGTVKNAFWDGGSKLVGRPVCMNLQRTSGQLSSKFLSALF